jgi:hypothetical protein
MCPYRSLLLDLIVQKQVYEWRLTHCAASQRCSELDRASLFGLSRLYQWFGCWLFAWRSVQARRKSLILVGLKSNPYPNDFHLVASKVEEFYFTQYLNGSFSLVNVGIACHYLPACPLIVDSCAPDTLCSTAGTPAATLLLRQQRIWRLNKGTSFTDDPHYV